MRLFARKLGRVPPAVPPRQRVYAIGDVHGRLDLYDALIDRIAADDRGREPAETTLVLLGDLIDRGPDSAGVIERAMTPLDWATTRLVRGNHEAALLDALGGNIRMLWLWLGNGGDAAARSWGIAEDLLETAPPDRVIGAVQDAIPARHRAWLAQSALSIRIGDYYFVHAGIRPGVRLDRQNDADRLWIREDFLDSPRDHGAVVVHGHSVSENVELLPNRIGLDTGAYSTGRLSAVGLDGTERWIIQT